MTLLAHAHTLASLPLSWTPFARGGLWPLIPLLWILAIGLIVWLITRRRPVGYGDPARQLLAERYARGELSAEEYHERLENLR